MADHRAAEQRGVADGVQDLVAHELVREAQAVRVEDAELVHHDGVVQRAAAGEPHLLEHLHVAQEAEGARAGDLPGEARGR